MGYNADQKIRFRYRLNDNFKEDSDTKQIEGLNVKKSDWTIFNQKEPKFYKFVKTLENETGMLDYEMFSQLTGEIFDSSVNNYNKLVEGKIPTYTLAVLSVMKRPQIEQIANLLNINSMHKIQSVLVHAIIDKQVELKELLKNRK